MTDILTLGESMGLLRAAAPDTVELATTLRLGVAGAESNVAIGASRLGASVGWVGRVGDDDVGRRIVRELRAEGVLTHAVVDPAAASALVIKEVPPYGPSRVRYYRGGSAGSRLAPHDVPCELVAGTGLIHLTGITPSLSASAEAAVRHVLDLADDAGVPVSFDVNHRASLPRHRDARATYLDIARRATILFAGEDEARLLVDAGDHDDLLAELEKLGPSEVVLKLGEQGCSAVLQGSRLSTAAVPVGVVDTVGAGDAFVAGYLADRALGRTFVERLDTAVLCGALACTHPGDWEGSPRRVDVVGWGSESDPVVR